MVSADNEKVHFDLLILGDVIASRSMGFFPKCSLLVRALSKNRGEPSRSHESRSSVSPGGLQMDGGGEGRMKLGRTFARNATFAASSGPMELARGR